MIYRFKEVKHIQYNGEESSTWYIQYKYTFWPFWFTIQEFGYAGSFDHNFDSIEEAEQYLQTLIVESKTIYHEQDNPTRWTNEPGP